MKVETIDADYDDLLSRINLTNEYLRNNMSPIPRLNTRRRSTKMASSSIALPVVESVKELASLLDSELDRLVEIYQDDMDMFGYSWRKTEDGDVQAKCLPKTVGRDNRCGC